MRLNITIDMDNAAFEDPGEVGRILKTAAKKIEVFNPLDGLEDDEVFNLRDINGNTVGRVTLTND